MTRTRVSTRAYGRGIVNMRQETVDTMKHVADGISIVTVLGTILDALPAVAALFSIIWSIIRIYETETVQKLLKRKGTNA